MCIYNEETIRKQMLDDWVDTFKDASKLAGTYDKKRKDEYGEPLFTFSLNNIKTKKIASEMILKILEKK